MKILEMMVGSRGMGDAKAMAEMLRRMGRRGDTMLAHITPEEADMLMEAGGSGTINPMTGLPEFARRRLDTYYGFAPEAETFRVDQPEIERFQPEPAVSAEVRPGRGAEQNTYFVPRPSSEFRDEPYGGISPDRMPRRAEVTDTYFAGRPTDERFQPYGGMTPLKDLTALEDYALRTDVGARREGGGGGFAERAEQGLGELQDILDRYPNLTRAGTAGASVLAQALMFNQANQAMRRDIEATRAAAQPFRQAQSEAMGRATGEGLTAEQQQELEIQQARAREQLGQRGTPTGSAAAGILAAQQRRARSLARQESFGEALRLANIADQYDRRALEMELQRDQQLAQLFAGILGREVQQAQRTQAPAPAATGR
jgi:hypothetical protein